MLSRQFWTKTHRYTGLFMAGFLFVAGITGALIAFNDELDATLNPSMMRVEANGNPPLNPDRWVRSVENALPSARVVYVSLPKSDNAAARFGLEPRRGSEKPTSLNEAFVDPYTARFLGAREWGAFRIDAPHLMPFIYRLHYTLHLPGMWGIWLFGLVAIAWLSDCFVGFYLTLPVRKPKARNEPSEFAAWWAKWAPAWRIKTSASVYRINFDLHRACGLWLWPLFALLAFTSIALNLNDEVFAPLVSIFGTISEPPLAALTPLDAAPQERTGTFAGAIEKARTHVSSPELRAASVSFFADYAAYQVTFNTPAHGEAPFALRQESVLIDAASGKWLGSTSYDDGTAADKFLKWQFPIHSGEILGFPGRIAICLAGIGTAVLSVTGIVIWWKKLRSRQAKMKTASTASR